MELTEFIEKARNGPFKKITWIYLTKKNVFENKEPDASSETLSWVPSKHSGTMAGATGFGNIVNNDRTVLVSYDRRMMGVYKIEGPIRVGQPTILKKIVDLKNRSVKTQPGGASGCYLLKDQLLKLLEEV